MKAPLLNPNFTYHSSEESRKPGYLARKFAAYRKKMAREEVVSDKVTKMPIRKAK